MKNCRLFVEPAIGSDCSDGRFPALSTVKVLRPMAESLEFDLSLGGKYTVAIADGLYERFLAPDGLVWGNGREPSTSVDEAVRASSTAFEALEGIWRFVTMPDMEYVAIFKIVDEGADVVLREIFRLTVSPSEKRVGPVEFSSDDCPSDILDWARDFGVYEKSKSVSKKGQ